MKAEDGRALHYNPQTQKSPRGLHVAPVDSVEQSHHSPTVTEPQIRHSGRAHVRGKIRRVWRPRYLEVWDNGLVRYYEENDSRYHIPRYTLMIYQARILDATTFRDMHVGLPTSTYGFMFRGQRLLSETSETVQCSPDAVQYEQRDFLCAVASLQEAQMWVVAMQWAAARNTSLALASPSSRSGSWTDPWWKDEFIISSPQLSPLPSDREWEPSREEDEMMRVPVLESCAVDTTSALNSSTEKSRNRLETRSDNPGSVALESSASSPRSTGVQNRFPEKSTKTDGNASKIVITRVTQYRIVRLANSLRFEVAYEIRVMLLQRSKKAEQWSLLRTADDFQRLAENLESRMGDSRKGVIQRLPRLRNRPSTEDLQASLAVVDSLLRSAVVESKTVNTNSLKSFLSLSSGSVQSKTNAVPLCLRWLKGHDDQSVLTRMTAVRLDGAISTDRFVKNWLQSCTAKQSIVDTCAARVLQIGSLWCDKSCITLSSRSTLLLATAVLPLTGRIFRQYVPIVPIRLDLLVLTWASAAYFGSIVLGTHNGYLPLPNRSPDKLVQRDSAKDTPPKWAERKFTGEDDGEESDGDEAVLHQLPISFDDECLSSPLPKYPSKDGHSCWSQPGTNIFHVRGASYLTDKVKIQSGPAPLTCLGVDMWMTDSPQRNIARHPSVLGGRLAEQDTFLVNFLLPFGNLVAYFSIPPLNTFPQKLQGVWERFCHGDQEYRDARLKLLPVVVEGPWIVKAAVGPGKSPALLGKVIPLQYFFRDPDLVRKGIYEVDVIITASSIAKGILSVVRGHTKSVSIAFAFIIEGISEEELPESVLCCFQMHSLHLENCPILTDHNLDDMTCSEQ